MLASEARGCRFDSCWGRFGWTIVASAVCRRRHRTSFEDSRDPQPESLRRSEILDPLKFKNLATLGLGIVIVALAGCGPHVDLVATRSRRIEDNGRLKAVLVESMYMTKGLHGEQMEYDVGVLDSAKRPVMARQSSYRNSRGQIAGSRTVLAEEVTGTPSIVAVEIPVNVLGMGERDLPAFAHVTLSPVNGEAKGAETTIELPLAPPDVFAMGGPASPAPVDTDNREAEPTSNQYASRTDDAERDPWNDRRDAAPRRPQRESFDDPQRRDDNLESAERSEETADSTQPSRKSDTAQDDLTYWTPDRKPIKRETESTPPSRAGRSAHDDRLARNDAPPAPPERAPEGRSARDPYQAEIDDLEPAVRNNPNDLERQMRLRMLYLAQHRESAALAPIGAADSDVSAKIDEYLAAILPAVRTGRIDPAAVTMSQLNDWVERARSAKELRIPTAAFCRSIDGFGKYRAFDPAIFPAGVSPKPLIYLEVENFVSTQARTGVYRTLLSVQQKLLNSEGVEIWSTLDQEIPDVSNELRAEFFLAIGPIDFQQILPAGDYTLVISLRDVLGRSSCEKRLRFRVAR